MSNYIVAEEFVNSVKKNMDNNCIETFSITPCTRLSPNPHLRFSPNGFISMIARSMEDDLCSTVISTRLKDEFGTVRYHQLGCEQCRVENPSVLQFGESGDGNGYEGKRHLLVWKIVVSGGRGRYDCNLNVFTGSIGF